MSFTRALFYPSLEIADEGWLKTAILYWDEIQTISPASIEVPYQTSTALQLFHEGVLSPLHVHPEKAEVRAIEEEMLNYMDSHEADGIVMTSDEGWDTIHVDKLPDFRRRAEYRDALIHEEKWGEGIRSRIGKQLLTPADPWISVDKAFANFYMTLLATRLSESSGLGLLTDIPESERLSTSARLNSHLFGSKYRNAEKYNWGLPRTTEAPRTLSQGILANFLIENIFLAPETSVDSILSFKRHHVDELRRFQVVLGELTTHIEAGLPLRALQQHLQDIYRIVIAPVINELKAALHDSRIRCIAESFLKISGISVASGSLLPHIGLATQLHYSQVLAHR
jgi:hypothetical protein